MVASWPGSKSVASVTNDKQGWVEPSGTKPGSVTCFDLLYFASDKGEEVREALAGTKGAPKDAGAWAMIGRYAHWNEELKWISVELLRKALGMGKGRGVPEVSRRNVSSGRLVFFPIDILSLHPDNDRAHSSNGLYE